MHRLRRSMSTLFLFALALAAAPLSASHQPQLDEAMAGAFGRPDIQFVEVRFSFCDQNQWGGARRLAFFDAAGAEVGEFVVPTNPRADCDVSGQSVLFGTQAFADLPSTPAPDFLIPPLMVPGSGKVCFQSIPAGTVNQCLSYGSFTGATEQGSSFNAPSLSSLGTCSLKRFTFLNDFGSPNFNEDFALLAPAPRNGAGETGTVEVPPRFADVPAASPFRRFVEALFNAGVTGGCGNGAFCPTALVSREQMAVLLLRAAEGPAFQPPACLTPMFDDVPCSSPFAPWINELAARGISGGCGGGDFCPGSPVTREQMAVFLLLAVEGSGFSPPACATPRFDDVPCSSPFAPWVNELAARGITGGCGGGNFCPEGSVTREQMAVFLSTAFALPVPFVSCPAPPAPQTDDHGDTAASATPVPPGAGPVNGVIDPASDRDFFSFNALAGDAFRIETILLSSVDTTITVLGPDGTTALAFDDDGGPGLASQLLFNAQAPGTYFVAVASFSSASTGSYQLVIQPLADDHGDTPETATPIALGPTATPGVIEVPGDLDVFHLPVTGGQGVIVETVGTDPLMESSLQILSGNTVIAIGSRGETGAAATVFFVAPAGDVFARVGHSFFGTGSYGIRARLAMDDHGGTEASATPLTPAAPVAGEWTGGDVDLFSFNAAAGQIFVVEIQGLFAGNNLDLTFLGPGTATFRDSEFLSGLALERFTLITPTTGTYFVQVGGSFSSPGFGAYRITLQGPIADDHGNSTAAATAVTPNGPPTDGSNQFEGDADFFSFFAAEGEAYRLVAEGTAPGSFPEIFLFAPDGLTSLGGFDNDLVLVAAETGTHFAGIAQTFFEGTGPYRLTVTGPIPDDHGNIAATATPVTPGDPAVEADLDFENDRDFFSFPAQAGEAFLLKAPGNGLILAVFDTDGRSGLVSSSSFANDDFTARILFTAPADGTFFARISSAFSHNIGPYTLSITPFPDDHGNLAATATLLTVGAPPVAGAFEIGGDVDFFAFDAGIGETLVIETSQLASGADTVLEVFDANGFQLARDDDGGGGLASRITFTAPATDRFFARVRHFSFAGTGSYRMAVSTP